MPVKSELVDNRCLSVTVSCADLGSEGEIARTFDDLLEGLAQIATAIKVGGDDLTCCYYNVCVLTPNSEVDTWSFPEPEGIQGMWERCGAAFWFAVARTPSFHRRIAAYLDRLVEVMRTSRRGLYEGDELAFGESVATLLALASVDFVPFYANLMRHWDMDHEVMQGPAIDAIVRRNGLCPQIEDLLFVRVVENPGQFGADQLGILLPFLEEQTSGFTASSFFRRLVTGLVPNPSDKHAIQTLSIFLPESIQAPAQRILWPEGV